MEIIQAKFDDLLIVSIGKERVVSTLTEDHPLVNRIRVTTMQARNDYAKSHVILVSTDATVFSRLILMLFEETRHLRDEEESVPRESAAADDCRVYSLA